MSAESQASVNSPPTQTAPHPQELSLGDQMDVDFARASLSKTQGSDKSLANTNFWNTIPWSALHDPVRTFDVIPDAVKPAIADFTRCRAMGVQANQGTPQEEHYLKALFFSDRVLLSSSKRSRGGARGQKGETLTKTIARRLRTAWSGEWSAVWEESNGAMRRGASLAPSEAQQLARQVKAIEEALANEDIREALRCVDGQVKLASDAKARRCLPSLFPQKQSGVPSLPEREPLPEDVARFGREIKSAYRHAPRHRAPGPGGSRNEHWSWMPAHEHAWEPMEQVLLRFALCKLPDPVMRALHGARVLAGDRPEEDKVRPFALEIIHRRLCSKAAKKTFQARVSAVVSPIEYSLGSKCGAELMHKTVLVDLDIRDNACKFGFDASNAHNEFERDVATEAVSRSVPDMVPWVRGCLLLPAVHVHVGSDGKPTEVLKTRGGDQGDALTSIVFPLTYKRVSAAVETAASTSDAHARVYTYQDDLDAVCTARAYDAASTAYAASCRSVGLRANLSKTTVSPGRGTDVESPPANVKVEPRALVLRHGQCTPVPALPANHACDGSQLAEGSPEVQQVIRARDGFCYKLRRLRAAGLPALASTSLLRARTAGDFVFVARACGIPLTEAQALDNKLSGEECVPGPAS